MSGCNTLDIQLTELGFPDVLQPEDSSVKRKPSEDSSSASPLNGTAPPEPSESAGETPQRGEEGPKPGEETSSAGTQRDADDDSDDSEVSDVYEDEEIDEEEDEEDEEVLGNGMIQCRTLTFVI